MSSMASASDHIDHVRTQLPYAITVGFFAVFLGYLPAGFNFPPLVSFIVSAILLAGIVWWLGKPEKSYSDVDAP
jgi:Na+/H+ antiporter NhaC